MSAQMQFSLSEPPKEIKFASVDDELGEICSVCEIELDDQNRNGSEAYPMCTGCYINMAFLNEWLNRGGTPEALEELKANTPQSIKYGLRHI